MRIAIATAKVPFVWGGAEIQAQGLLSALKQHGHDAEIFAIPFKWYPPERILDHMLACRLLDLTESEGKSIDLLIGLKFPAYLMEHPNKVLWVIHQHRQAYELWDDSIGGDLIHHANGIQVREAIRAADKAFIPKARAVFAESRNVAKRLKAFCNIDSEPLYHPPLGVEHFYSATAADYFFFPSRITALKRQELVLEALAKTRQPVSIKFASVWHDPGYLTVLQQKCKRMGLENRVEWLGSITEKEKCTLYAECIAVVYPPFDEDYGYVTLEAMLSSKALITCQDSGGPLEFVEHGCNGLIAAPDPLALAEALDTLWTDRSRAARFGVNGLERYRAAGVSWTTVVNKLLG
jgi:glycosyltransferase involved in cell wall biosynthesis